LYIFTSVYTFFILTFISPLGKYINKHTHAWSRRETLLGNLTVYYGYLLVIACLGTLIGYFFYQSEAIQGISVDVYLLLLFGFILFVPFNQTVVPLLNMLHDRISFTVLTTLTFLGTLVFGYLLVSLFGHGVQDWLFGMMLSHILFGVVGYVVLKIKVGKSNNSRFSLEKVTKQKIKKISKFVIPLVISVVFVWLQNSGYRIIVEKNLGLEFLGFFGVGMMVAMQISSVVESIVMQYFHPTYFQDITDTTLKRRKQAIDKLINTVLPIYIMLALFLTFLAKPIMEVLVDQQYHDAYLFMIFGAWVELFRMSTSLFENVSQSEMNTKKIIYPYVAGGIITILLVYFSSFESKYELLLPVSLLLGGFFTSTLMFFSMKKLINFYISYRLLLVSVLVSIPYASFYFMNIGGGAYTSFLVALLFGLYFLGSVFFIYRKSLMCVVPESGRKLTE